MSWFTEFEIKVLLKEYMTSDFADKIDKLYNNATIDGKKLTFKVILQKGRLEDLKKLLEDVSYLFDGMFWRITGTLQGADARALAVLHRRSDLTCSTVAYFVYKQDSGYYIEVEEKYEKYEVTTIPLDKNGKRVNNKVDNKTSDKADDTPDSKTNVTEEEEDTNDKADSKTSDTPDDATEDTEEDAEKNTSDKADSKTSDTPEEDDIDTNDAPRISYCCLCKSSKYELEDSD